MTTGLGAWSRLAAPTEQRRVLLPASLRVALREDVAPWLGALSAPLPLRLTVVVPDDTRPEVGVPTVPIVLTELAEQLDGADVVIVVGSGLHPPPGSAWLERLRAVVQAPAIRALRLELHDASETEAAGLPLSRWVLPRSEGGWADAVVSVGVVEPHQYAGFSGGSKGITIGCGSASTIASLHSLELLRDPRVLVANLTDNPFRRRLDDIAQSCAPRRSISVVPHPSGSGFVGLAVGSDPQAFARASALASDALLAPLGRQFDYAVIDVPASKASSFYQASRAMTYVGLHRSPCVRAGGTLVLVAPCERGYGTGRGEHAFAEALGRGRDVLLDELRGRRAPPATLSGGAQRAYVLAKLVERFRCVLVGSPRLPEAQRLGVVQVDTLDDIELGGDGLRIEDPFVRLPYFDAAVQGGYVGIR